MQELWVRGVVPGGAMAPPVFGRSVNPISTRGADYAHHITAGTPGFSDLPTALHSTRYFKIYETLIFTFYLFYFQSKTKRKKYLLKVMMTKMRSIPALKNLEMIQIHHLLADLEWLQMLRPWKK